MLEYHDNVVRNVKSQRVQCDEIWCFCYAKDKNLPDEMRGQPGVGSMWTWTELDADAIAIEDRGNTAAAMPDVLRCGRPLGSKGSLKQFLADWRQAFDDFCRQLGIVKRFCITQGCVIEKTDGTRFQLRNFDRASRWMKGSPFKDIRRVFRSPIRLLKDDGAIPSDNR